MNSTLDQDVWSPNFQAPKTLTTKRMHLEPLTGEYTLPGLRRHHGQL